MCASLLYIGKRVRLTTFLLRRDKQTSPRIGGERARIHTTGTHFADNTNEVTKGVIIKYWRVYIRCQKIESSGARNFAPVGSHLVPRMISSTTPLIIRKFVSVGFKLMFIVFWSLLVLNHNSSSPALFVITLMPLTYCRVSSSCAIITTFSGVNGFPMSQQAMAVNWTNWKNITPL